jgi:hypothetical protein
VIIIWARNEETGEVNGFLVEKGTKGLRTEKIENKMCFRCVQKYYRLLSALNCHLFIFIFAI